MNRTPPNLVYLTIYNPSLRSTGPPNDDDDDAEEQAHILFYTSKERAVSRDRMLRQIGLAKALVSFAGMFNAESPLDTVHSQTRRMIMVSPEPNFWIHAVGTLLKGKSKARAKGKEKEKDKGKDIHEGPVYDYEDGSVHDGALKEDIMRGYERFKLTHGSFTAILNALGQEALGLRLERFWTPWAWSWSLEDSRDFGPHLGVPLHPYFKALIPTLDETIQSLSRSTSHLLSHHLEILRYIPLLLTPISIIPSTSYLSKDYSISLPLYLSSLIPPPRDPSIQSQDDQLASSQATIKGIDNSKEQEVTSNKGTSTGAGGGGSFLNMKWNWSGVLNFNRSEGEEGKDGDNVQRNEEDVQGKHKDTEEDRKSFVETTVDQNALDDAMSSKVSPTPSVKEHSEEDRSSAMLQPPATSPEDKVASSSSSLLENATDDDVHEEEDEKKTIQEQDVVTPKALPAFLRKTVHVQDGDDPLTTSQRNVYFLLKGQWMLALIDRFFETLDEIIQEESVKSMTDSIPSASRILQPLDVHIGSTGKYTFGSKSFHSKSGLLHEARALQDRDPEILEVFSRGQNPQYWHMARRTRSPPSGGGGGGGGVGSEPTEMYMEVFRKETSLSDVDNVMAGAVKNWKGVLEDVEECRITWGGS
ncbi:hypothetical protein AN958_07047 [Leucoagaricus sp. SymC.cos]|nr:hypothetical protein AN958_07047 [Leucoagaricus sp. SymC.cos]